MSTKRAFVNRRQMLGALALGAASAPWWARAAMSRKPNIVLIVADDLGYAELGVQGCKDIPTPNIDSIARSGVRFTDGYVSCPICAPTRAGLMTGRYQQRFGFETNPGPEAYAAENFGLPRTETTLAERLKTLGYPTGMVGKWHLGFKADLTPPRRGFDEFFGFLGGANNYLPGAARNTILRGMEPVAEKEYLTDAFGREAVAFIEKNKGRPFFLYLPFNAVHSPLQAIEKYSVRFPKIPEGNRRTYAAMTAAMDDAVGRVLETLRKNGLEENTLIFFLSDNGGPTPQTTSSNLPLRGYKGQVYEGGVRIPFMMQWKGTLPAGKVDRRPVISLDLHATALAAAGATSKPEMKLDGVDLVPYLTAKSAGAPHDTLYWRFHAQRAIRRGDWKLVASRGTAWELYNLAEDIGEKNDLAAKMPGKVEELEEAWQAWNAQLMDLQWIRQDATTESAPNRPRAGRAAKAPGAVGNLEERFKALDRNGDGKLTPDELSDPQLFKRMDLNGDGVVTLEEARRAFPSRSPEKR
jgi:arylsulfatase A-like enzyme